MTSKVTRVWLVAVTMVLFVTGVSGTSAGQQRQGLVGDSPVMNQAAIQRSLAVQAELARIEANKEAFIDELFGRWAPYLDPLVYDLWGSLKPIAMAATPWRLLGASLTTDFESGSRVLRGVVGPGWYIGPYIEGREPLLASATVRAQAGGPGMGAATLGDPASSLVFKPIAPCRMVDTRGTPGLRTGIMAAGSTRTFDLSAYGKGQGDDTSCSNFQPWYQPKAWAVNITVTGHSDLGHLTVWPYDGAMPSTSFMNFSPAVYAMANAGTVTGCLGCLLSINVYVSATTHVIIDVMGYYEEATGFAGGYVTWLAASPQTLRVGGSYDLTGPKCPDGTVLIGGGADASTRYLSIGRSFPGGAADWKMTMTNAYGADEETATPYTGCIDSK